LISSLYEDLKTPSYVRWVNKENLHITLKFLGQTDKKITIETKIKEAVRQFSPFKVSLKGIGAFPSPKRAKILWVGVKEGTTHLTDLFVALEKKIHELGFEQEMRKFTPHITFARVKNGKYSLSENIDFSFDSFPVNEVALFKSILTPKGPIYEMLSTIPLGGES
jgi:2'-5' RNA ligase